MSIIPPKAEDEVTRFAIQDLARYLREITGETITLGKASAKHHIFVGEAASGLEPAAARRLREDLKVEPDGFILRRAGPDVVILGKGPRGNVYGLLCIPGAPRRALVFSGEAVRNRSASELRLEYAAR